MQKLRFPRAAPQRGGQVPAVPQVGGICRRSRELCAGTQVGVGAGGGGFSRRSGRGGDLRGGFAEPRRALPPRN